MFIWWSYATDVILIIARFSSVESSRITHPSPLNFRGSVVAATVYKVVRQNAGCSIVGCEIIGKLLYRNIFRRRFGYRDNRCGWSVGST